MRADRKDKRKQKRDRRKANRAAKTVGDRAEPLAEQAAAVANNTESSMVRPRLPPADLNLSPLREPPMKLKKTGNDGGGSLPQVPLFPGAQVAHGNNDSGRGGGLSSRAASPGSCSEFSVRSRPLGCTSSDASDFADDQRPVTTGGNSRSRRRRGKTKR